MRPHLARLKSEPQAHPRVDPGRGRHWLIASQDVRNRLGTSVAYELVPGRAVLPFADWGSDVIRRGPFPRENLWVTPHAWREPAPAGDRPKQHPAGAALTGYQSPNRTVVGDDIVVWYVFGMLHVARPDDWPVMPVERIRFTLKPIGFFDRKRSLDVPAAYTRPACELCGYKP